ncbi:gluconate 2-dehydrogenase subunit 3 family protein [Haloarcula sp. S1CR25-12]|uniref:Gluconate 2-dehydrogenase subunit 3 family protein n=1 Tax=Haloarcula saliterrae TaxID=2950534 RepID=A0ABU2F672_9EURY|nr:gluconate 2-dehydrogenase subunit 3 family protein [Haloarcula sp. S1CR25-12]MDS0257788.1 gluconate 2-dehydrogenase subunit 3 family protein [Haloarcula sp. S1CR25-12]
MKLTRRDAIGALSTAGIAAVAGCESLGGDRTDTESGTKTAAGTPGDGEMGSDSGAMMALAEALYPSDAEVTEEYLGTYLYGRMVDEESYRTEVQAGVDTLDRLARDAHESRFAELSGGERVGLIEDTDLRTGDSVPDGTDIQRANYYLVDELLFAFYASPTGGERVGNPNPRGWPGGYGYNGAGSP